MITYRMRIDIKGKRILQSDAVFTTGDVQAYRLQFAFYDESAFVLDGCSLLLKGKRSDGVVVADEGIVCEENIAYYDVKSSMYAVAGELRLEVALVTADGGYVTTKEIVIAVREGHGEGELAENTMPLLSEITVKLRETDTMLDRAITATEAAEQVALAEEDRVRSEELRVIAEEKRANNEIIRERVKEETETAKQEAIMAAETANRAAMTVNLGLYANVLKGSASGSSIFLDDVSPIEHVLEVKLSSKNLIPFPYYNTSRTHYGVEYVVNDDGSVVCNGTSTGGSQFLFVSITVPIKFSKGTYYWHCLPQEQTGVSAWVRYSEKTYRDTGKGIVVNLTEDTELYFYVTISTGTTVENLVLKPQFEKGTMASAYTPYVENVGNVIVKRYGTDEGDDLQEYTSNADGTVDNVKSIYPKTILMTDAQGIVVECKYNKDSNKVIEKLTNAIISLGGNV